MMRITRLAGLVLLLGIMGVTGAAPVVASATAPAIGPDAPLPELYRKMLDAPALVRGGTGVTAWSSHGRGLWHIAGGRLRLIDPATGAERLTLDEARLRAALAERFGEAVKTAPLPLETMDMTGDGRIALRWGGAPATIDVGSYAVTVDGAAKMTPTGTFLRYLFMYPGFPTPDGISPDGRMAATVLPDGNIGVRTLTEEKFRPLTADAVERFGWDLDTRRVSLGALRASETTPWSPDGDRLFAMRIDRRALPQVPEFRPLTDPLPEVVQRDVFPAGGPYYRYLPAIIDVTTGRQTPVKLDLGTDYALFLAWADDGKTAYMARLDRRFSRIDVIAVDASTGAARTILTERDPRGGLRSPHAIFYAGNAGFTPLPGDEGFLWLSERDGWNHIYHHSPSGRLIRRLTSGAWRVENVSAVDVARGRVYFTGRPDAEHIYDVHVMSVRLAGGKVARLSEGRGTHDQPLFSPDKTMFVDRFESFDVPPRIELRRTDGTRVAVIEEADASALYAAGWKPPLEFTVDGPDGVPVHGVMFRPFDFDPAKRYPVIDYMYGGPQALWSYPTFVAPGEAVGANMPLAMAQLGYVVLKFDTAGTPGRSRDYQIAVREKWGPGIAGDHAAVIRALGRKYPWLDASRAGIFGHSWGGLNVLHALASHGDMFTAGVASAPGFGIPSVPDGFFEAYLGNPAQNPDAWARADIMRTITNIRSPLMLVSGTQDYMIYLSTLRASNALIKAGLQHEVALAPSQGHGIYGPYADYLTEKEVRFFLRHIPPAGAAE